MEEEIKTFRQLVKEKNVLIPVEPLKEKYLVTKKIEENGTIVNKLDFVDFEETINKDLKVSDFKIENLQATGAIKGLKLFGSKPNINELENELTNFEKTIDDFNNKED